MEKEFRDFCRLVVGPPGCGKSTRIKNMLEGTLNQVFHRVYFFGPSCREEMMLDEENSFVGIDEELLEEIISDVNSWEKENKNILFVMDDAISQIFVSRSKPWILDLFFNRRHKIKQGKLSILITAQKWTTIPTSVRACITHLDISKIQRCEAKAICRDTSLPCSVTELELFLKGLPQFQFLTYSTMDGRLKNDEGQILM